MSKARDEYYEAMQYRVIDKPVTDYVAECEERITELERQNNQLESEKAELIKLVNFLSRYVPEGLIPEDDIRLIKKYSEVKS